MAEHPNVGYLQWLNANYFTLKVCGLLPRECDAFHKIHRPCNIDWGESLEGGFRRDESVFGYWPANWTCLTGDLEKLSVLSEVPQGGRIVLKSNTLDRWVVVTRFHVQTGNEKAKRVPVRSVLDTLIDEACSSRMRLTIARPKPTPSPTSRWLLLTW